MNNNKNNKINQLDNQDRYIEIIEIRDKKSKYGKLEYDKINDQVYYKNKYNVITAITHPTKSNQDLDNYLKYCGIWNNTSDYHINSLVKYHNKLYIASCHISKNTKPTKSDDWELIFTDKSKTTEVADIKLHATVNTAKKIIPLLTELVSETSFIDYIDANKSIYIKQGNYQVIYNIVMTTDIENITVSMFEIMNNKPESIKKSITYKNKTKNMATININHSFIYQISDGNTNTITETCGFDDDIKLVISIIIDEEDLDKNININNQDSWIQITKLS